MTGRSSRGTVLVPALLLALSTVSADAQRGAPAHVVLAPADHAELARIELLHGNAARGPSARLPVSDLLLRVRTPTGDVRSALTAPNGFRTGPRQPLLLIDVMVVAAGRIVVDERVACRGWVADVTICAAECEGGQFALEREEGGGITITFGRLPKDLGEHLEPGYRMAACSPGADRALAPVRAHSATLSLRAR